MIIVFAFAGLVFFLFSFPVVAELGLFLFANLFLRRRRPSRSDRETREERLGPIVVLVPAHNEEKNIERCVSSLLAAEAGPYAREVVVIADNCTDATAAVARRAGARALERFDEANRGKGAALHYAISLLLPEGCGAFVVVDADSVVSADFVRAMGDRFADGAEAVQCLNMPLNVEASPRIRLMNLALLSMNVFRPMGRELLGFSVGILGNGFGLSAKLLREVPYTANSIAEDLEYHLRLIEGGRRVRFVGTAEVLSDFPLTAEGNETQRARWEGGRFMLQRKHFFPLLRKILSGRSALIEPFLELMSMPLSYEVLLLLFLSAIPSAPFRLYGLFGLALLAAQTVAAVALYGKPRDFRAFLEIPGYLFWKIAKLPVILLNSRKGSAWVRTKRD